MILKNEKSENVSDKEKFNDYYKARKLTEDTTCGYWIFKNKFFQRFASNKSYTLLYGLVACSHTASFAYFSGTISTMEKRLKIPSKQTGLISVTNYFSNILINVILSYYVSKQHKPRWIAFGVLSVSLFCFLNFLPHLIFGPGNDALKLTVEYSRLYNDSRNEDILQYEQTKDLCLANRTDEMQFCGVEEMRSSDENTISIIILYVSQLISGIGASLLTSLGVAYMDDNVKKSMAPALFSATFFIRLLGPAFGYTVASYSLLYYIALGLEPVIDNKDPRWMGAWWLGWLFFAFLLLLAAFLISLFPKHLPKAAALKEFKNIQLKSQKCENNSVQCFKEVDCNDDDDEKATWKDLKITLSRILRNKILITNSFSATFYGLAYLPYTFYVPKYMEIQYRVSQSIANVITGTLALTCTGIGLLFTGFIITKFQPRARYLPGWNIIASALLLIGVTMYSFLGCNENENSTILSKIKDTTSNTYCNITSCNCDFIKYSPVCGTNNETFISPCHAGCTHGSQFESNTKSFENCSCVSSASNNDHSNIYKNSAASGSCPADCSTVFKIFVVILCINKFLGGTQGTSNFLISFRCVEPKDKAVSMAVTTVIRNLFAAVPGPILYGYIYDSSCILWGEMCEGTGNCWLYDAFTLRQRINILVTIFVIIAATLDGFVCYMVKDIKIFDEKKDTKLKENDIN